MWIGSRPICFQLFPLFSKVQRSCAGQDMFGVQLCAEAQVPDIPSLRLQQIPVLSAFGQTDVRLSMEPTVHQNQTQRAVPLRFKEIEFLVATNPRNNSAIN